MRESPYLDQYFHAGSSQVIPYRKQIRMLTITPSVDRATLSLQDCKRTAEKNNQEDIGSFS